MNEFTNLSIYFVFYTGILLISNYEHRLIQESNVQFNVNEIEKPKTTIGEQKRVVQINDRVD